MEIRDLRSKKTNVDFKEHIFTEETFVCEEKKIYVYHLRHKNGSNNNYVKFTVNNNTTLVEGDRGNWIFNKCFHPHKNGYVSSQYWVEKLKTSSTQEAGKFSSKITKEIIKDNITDFNDIWGNRPDLKKWFCNLYDELDHLNEHEYVQLTYVENPYDLDAEDIPFGKELHYDLKVVFDVYNEMCNRLD